MKFSVLWTSSAIDDLDAICSYIAQYSTGQTNNTYRKITQQAQSLETFPQEERVVPELAIHNIHTYRELISAHWRLLYRVEDTRVYILAIIDGRRELSDLLLQRLLR